MKKFNLKFKGNPNIFFSRRNLNLGGRDLKFKGELEPRRTPCLIRCLIRFFLFCLFNYVN